MHNKAIKRMLIIFSMIALVGAYLSTPTFATVVEPPVIPALNKCESITTVNVTPSSGVDFSDTRSAGHYEFTATGLHIHTDTGVTGSPDPRKVAGYILLTPFLSLSNAGDPVEMDYTKTSGLAPGINLQMDMDSTTNTPAGPDTGFTTLVGETVYNGDWWSTKALTGADVQSAGGGGSAWSAPLSHFAFDYPHAVVVRVGFSLGSGADGDGVLHSITVGCVKYNFTLDAPAPTTTVPASTTTAEVSASGAVVPPAVTLPGTGSNSNILWYIAIAMLVAGISLAAVGSRRQNS